MVIAGPVASSQPSWQAEAFLSTGGSRCGAHPLAGCRVIDAGFALPRDAGRRPALQAVRAFSRSAVRSFVALGATVPV